MPVKFWNRCKSLPWSKITSPLLIVIVIVVVILCVTLEVLYDNKVAERVKETEKYHQDLVNKINSRPNSWRAEYNKFAITAAEQKQWKEEPLPAIWNEINNESVRNNFGNITLPHWNDLNKQTLILPKHFDSRQKWSNCASIHSVRNQAGCGSCWAESAVSVMSDRICIKSNGTEQPMISSADLMGCCDHCGSCKGSSGSLLPFDYWTSDGLVTGGTYGSFEGCRPYPFSSECGWPCSPKTYKSGLTPKCKQKCQSSYQRSYAQDKYYGNGGYILNVDWSAHGFETPDSSKYDLGEILKKDIMLNGPVLGCFFAYEELQHYRSGIYEHRAGEGEYIYGHCSKIIGWGEENDVKFLIVTNSWGRNWGENGNFRMKYNETNLPPEIVSGFADI